MDSPVPADTNHKHFAGGQTETTVELAPGRHTLQLLLGDKNRPYDPPILSETITITVQRQRGRAAAPARPSLST